MDDNLELTRAELSERLGVSVGALRKWEGEFSQWITTPPGVKGYGAPRVFNSHDVIVFATIAKARREGKRIGDIRAELDERLAAVERDAALGESPLDTALGEGEPPARVQLALYMDTLKALESAEGELNATREERNYLRGRIAELEDKLVEAERRAARAEGERDMLAGRPPGFWQRLFGGGGSRSQE
jgi:DNA-binding transcriptional MerR regulator